MADRRREVSERRHDEMNLIRRKFATALAGLFAGCLMASGTVVYEVTSPYHHIRVVDQAVLRTLCFDDAT